MRQPIRTAALLCAALAAAACADTGTQARTDEPQSGARSEASFARGPLATGFILDRDGRPMLVTYEVREGRAIYQGDIDLGPAESIAASAPEAKAEDGPRFGVVRDGSRYRWPGAVVYYTVDSNLPQQSRVSNAISHIESKTRNVTFVPRTTQKNYVRFVRSTGCASSVGMVGGAQLIYLADGCSTGNTIHEISHALGMYHEQTRCDRDSYVVIHLENVIKGYENNFQKQCNGASDVLAYNEGSIMHYGPYDFSSNGLPTIVSLRGLDNQMGQRSGLSSTDVGTIDGLYP
ncbi:MAG TPA: M12 family metallopeptidase [Longimicrobium sp.]|nr:M12 family metallopeptidase [Longimicrobium sp.]